MARHYSPPGTWERIRKSVLEDPSPLTNPAVPAGACTS